MKQHSFTLMVLVTVTFLNGCSFFANNSPRPEQSDLILPISNKALIQSCDVQCSNRGGIKKKLCIKNCQFKQVRAERKNLIKACSADQESWWFRFTYIIKDILGNRCEVS